MAKISYYLKGFSAGGCSCDWGVRVTLKHRLPAGFCEGGGIWQIEQGHYGEVKLDGLRIGITHSPAALHLGNVTLLTLVAEQADARQPEAIEAMVTNATPI